jgi:purine catabolism regulator
VPPTLRKLLRHSPLETTLVGAQPLASLDEPVLWIHSSDLLDPTPFLAAGHLLLTTGTQFPESTADALFDDYVARLSDRGIVALGFGTEVVRAGTPAGLVTACASHGMPLVEIPYRVPFIAIIQWAADVIAREARARDVWALAAQRAVSLAAVAGGLPAVLDALASQLGCRVALFDADSTLDPIASAGAFDHNELRELSAEATRLLRRGGRAASSLTFEASGSRASLQTLGRPGHLRGVFATVGADSDAPASAVLTTAVALAEISLEEGRKRRGSVRPLHSQLFVLLLDGEDRAVLSALPTLPTAPVRLVLCESNHQDSLGDLLEGRTGFVAQFDGRLAVLVSADRWEPLRTVLEDQGSSAGVSDPVDYRHLSVALNQARRALSSSRSDGPTVVEFSELADARLLSLLERSDVRAVAESRLAPLLADDDGLALLRWSAVWLTANGNLDAASKQLGVHRHSLRGRLSQVEEAAGFDFARFDDRASLWAMLVALGLD